METAPPTLRAFRFGFFGHRLMGTGGQATGGSGTAGAASGGTTGLQTGGTTGTGGSASGGVSGGQTGGAPGTGGVTGGQTGGAPGTGGVAPGTGGATPGTGGVTPGTGGTSPPAGGTATGGSKGTGNCGNGKLDPGEACDGSVTQNASCAQLGFSGGTLACSASCQFNVSSCTGGTLKPTVVATRTICQAPCAVFFDATTTAGLSGSDYVGADWSWDFDSTGVDKTAGHRATIGFNVAHVYDNPGTYVVTTRVHDLAGAAGVASTTITVSAMTGTTYYVATSGNDSNNGTSTATPFLTLAKALTKAGPNVSVLFRRGDTFNVGSAEYDWNAITGPCLFGAYTDPAHASAAAPVFNTTVPSTGWQTFAFFNHVTDLRITDWNINASAGAYQVLETGTTSDLLFERVEISNVGEPNGDGINMQLINLSDRVFLVDSYFHDFDGLGIYGDRTTHLSVIGTRIVRYTNYDHGMRIQGGNTGPSFIGYANANYVADSTIQPTPGGHAFDSTTFRGDNTNAVMVNNILGSTASFVPQNQSQVEHVSKVLFEGNQTNMGDPYMGGVGVIGQHVVIRNNVMVGVDACLTVASSPMLPADWTTDIVFANNTMYRPGSVTQGGGVDCIQKSGTTGTLTVENNIWYQNATFNTSRFLADDGKGPTTESHNLGYAPNVSGTWPGAPTGAGDKVGNPMFVNPGSDFHLQPGSPAIDSGMNTHVYQSLGENPGRPQNSTWDMGAYE